MQLHPALSCKSSLGFTSINCGLCNLRSASVSADPQELTLPGLGAQPAHQCPPSLPYSSITFISNPTFDFQDLTPPGLVRSRVAQLSEQQQRLAQQQRSLAARLRSAEEHSLVGHSRDVLHSATGKFRNKHRNPVLADPGVAKILCHSVLSQARQGPRPRSAEEPRLRSAEEPSLRSAEEPSPPEPKAGKFLFPRPAAPEVQLPPSVSHRRRAVCVFSISPLSQTLSCSGGWCQQQARLTCLLPSLNVIVYHPWRGMASAQGS